MKTRTMKAHRRHREMSGIRLLCSILAIATLLIPQYVNAEESESTPLSLPVEGKYSLEIGLGRTIATYLSPLTYEGSLYGIAGRWEKALPFDPRHALMSFEGGITYSDMLNPAKTASMAGLKADFSFGISYRKHIWQNIQLTAGGYYGIEGGGLFLLRNSNNIAQALLSTGIGGEVSLSRTFRIGRLPILLSERIRLPLLGAFFCQQYGESYYEIYLGDHSGLAHFAWLGNYVGINNNLSVTLDFGHTSMEIGYNFRMQNQEANHLVVREWQHAFTIGVIPGGIGLKRARPNSISPLY